MMYGKMYALAAALGLALTSGAAQAAGDAAAGEKDFAKACKMCHPMKADGKGMGPYLGGVAGGKSGSVAGFKYKGIDGSKTWDDATLDAFLTDPKAVFPKSGMPTKTADAAKRANLIAYMKTLK